MEIENCYAILYHISTYWNNFIFEKKTAIAVVFFLGISVFNLLFFGQVETLESRSDYFLGGPSEVLVDEGGYIIAKLRPANSSTAEKTEQYQNIGDWPDLGKYLSIPARGWNWGHLHNYNAVDIANICGAPIYAAAEGLITELREGGWNEGYGSYIMISHPNNVLTKYAHNKKNLVSVGQYVLRGDLIAYIGNTGNTHGPTGCHLHFEVRGARNPFAKR